MANLVDPTPQWVWDPETLRIVDANALALAFWSAASTAELAERRFSREDPMVAGLKALSTLAAGDATLDLAPDGQERRVRVSATPRGRRIEVRHAPEIDLGDLPEMTVARLEAALRAAPTPTMLLAPDGRVLLDSASARVLLGEAPIFDARFRTPEAAARVRRTAWRRRAASAALEAANGRMQVLVERPASATLSPDDDRFMMATVVPPPTTARAAPTNVPIGWARFSPEDGVILDANAAFADAFAGASRLEDVLDRDVDPQRVDAIWIDGRAVRLETRSAAFGDVLASASVDDGRAVGELWQAPGSKADDATLDPSDQDRRSKVSAYSHAIRTHLQTLALAVGVARTEARDAGYARELELAAVVIDEIEAKTAEFLGEAPPRR